MFANRDVCPVCHTAVNNWATRCPKCRYHPDCDPQPYNRAQDDVALVARYTPGWRPFGAAPTVEGRDWRRLVPALLRRLTVA